MDDITFDLISIEIVRNFEALQLTLIDSCKAIYSINRIKRSKQ